MIYFIVENNDNMKKDSQSNISHSRSRNLYLDVAKGIAIILVVFGHNIQYGSFECNNEDFFENPLFIAIYSFHMPLFMLISGYLFCHSIKSYSWSQNVKSRFTKLVLPIIIWNSIYLFIMDAHKNIWEGSDIPLGSQLVSYLGAIWFLWAIFWCSMASLVVHRYFNDNIIAYVSLGLFALLLPGVLGISLYVYMYPYFVIGYLFNKYGLTNKIASLGNKIRVILSLLLFGAFVGLYMSYTKEDYIYISGTGIIKNLKQLEPELDLHQLSIDIFRYAIGLIGAICALIIIRVTYKHIGKNTSMLLGKIG